MDCNLVSDLCDDATTAVDAAWKDGIGAGDSLYALEQLGIAAEKIMKAMAEIRS